MNGRSIFAALPAPLLALALAFSASACSSASSEDGPAGTSEGELRGASVPGTAVIRFEGRAKTTTIGAKSKVQKALAAFKKPTGGEALPRCGFGPSTKMTFLNDKGEEIATGSYFCFRGTITLKGAREGFAIYFRPGDLDVLDEPLVPADVLWNVTKVEITKQGRKAEVRNVEGIRKLLGAFDIEQKITEHSGPEPRCMPTHEITFFSGHDDIAQSSYICDQEIRDKVKARFSIPNRDGEGEWLLQGDIKVDTSDVESAFADATSHELP